MICLMFCLLCLSLWACGEPQTQTENKNNEMEGGSLSISEKPDAAGEQTTAKEQDAVEQPADRDWETCFEGMKYTKAYKGLKDTNPVMTQRFGADPFAMVYGDRVYIYMTADALEYGTDGEVVENTYGKIRSLNVVSTEDMVNFTDHGSIAVAGRDGAAKWANNSWAPAAAWKEIDGKVQFFLYFADNGGGIGVLQSDSPTGPFTDPLGKALISRNTPNCADVTWLFDPAVLVDDDGRAYLYFGGGIPEGRVTDPGTARVVELGDDMISIKGEPQRIDVPYLFEDSGIHKAGDKYYYTYCSNWQVDEEGTSKYGFRSAEIVSMESDSPMGPFTVKERILENPGKYFGLYGNNHHCVFRFHDRWYIAYHTRVLEKAMGIEHGYRCTQIEEFTMGEDGTIGVIPQSLGGREQLKYVDALAENSAVNMAMQAGLDTAETGEAGHLVLSGIDSGDYMKVQGVDFGEKSPTELTAKISCTEESDDPCVIQVRIDTMSGEVIGYLNVEPEDGTSGDNKSAGDNFTEYKTVLEQEVTGVHDLYFVFSGSGYEMKCWKFQ